MKDKGRLCRIKIEKKMLVTQCFINSDLNYSSCLKGGIFMFLLLNVSLHGVAP